MVELRARGGEGGVERGGGAGKVRSERSGVGWAGEERSGDGRGEERRGWCAWLRTGRRECRRNDRKGEFFCILDFPRDSSTGGGGELFLREREISFIFARDGKARRRCSGLSRVS